MGKPLFIILSILFLLLPIYFESDTYYDVSRRKFVFSLQLYKYLKIVGGYLATYKGGLALHISKNKAILLPYAEWKEEQKRVSILKIFRLHSLKIQVETNSDYLAPILFLHHFLRILLFTRQGYQEKIKNCVCIHEGDASVTFSMQTVVWLNLAMVIVSLCKILKEQIKLWKIKTKKFAN